MQPLFRIFVWLGSQHFTLELCADAIGSILVGGGGAPPFQKNQRRPKNFLSKIPEKSSFHPQNFLMAFFSDRSKISTCSPHNGKLLSFFPFLRLPSLPLLPTLGLSQSLLSYRGYLSDLLFTPSSSLPSLLLPWFTSSLTSIVTERPVPPPLP